MTRTIKNNKLLKINKSHKIRLNLQKKLSNKETPSNKNQTYYQYIPFKKGRNHKCRESWSSALNKLGESCITLGLSMELAWRDHEGSSICFVSQWDYQSTENKGISIEQSRVIFQRLKPSLLMCKKGNDAKKLYENK